MPKFDGTGPQGKGPKTGRGMGPCGGGLRQGRGRRRIQRTNGSDKEEFKGFKEDLEVMKGENSDLNK